ncbi:MAG: enoyl-CoA hydratase-related protein, partial [Glaciecola sp.]
MSSVVNQQTNDNISVISMAGAPVNALSKAIRVGVIAAMEAALADNNIQAIVITSELPLFSAGADISEFSGGDLSPMLPEVLSVIENSSKPV